MDSKFLFSLLLVLIISENVKSTCLIRSTTKTISPATTTTIKTTNPSTTTVLVFVAETTDCANCANIETQTSKQITTSIMTSNQPSSSSSTQLTTTPCMNCNKVETSKRQIQKTTFQFQEFSLTSAESSSSTTESTLTKTESTTATTTTVTTTQPIVITTEITISPLEQCVHYSAAKFKISQAKAGFILSQIVSTSNDNPVPCCRACNLQPGCDMYSYAINNQNNAVCSLYKLPSNLGENFAYYPFLTRMNINNFVGFSYNFIGFF